MSSSPSASASEILPRRRIRAAAGLVLGLAAGWLPAGAEGGGPPPVSGETILDLIERQVSFGPRVPGTPAHAAALAWMKQRLVEAGATPVEQTWRARLATGEEFELTNIAAGFGPARDGGLLLGCHWDSRPWADEDPDSTRRGDPVPGANDGASGAAVLLALAQILGERPPLIPVILVFFDGEDLGRDGSESDWLLGSRYFVQHWPVTRPAAGIVLDMVCREEHPLDWDRLSYQAAPDVHRLLAAAEADAGLDLFSGQWNEPILDDHVPLIRAGLPTALLIGFGDPAWHTVSDLPSNCSARALEAVGSLLAQIIYGGYLQ